MHVALLLALSLAADLQIGDTAPLFTLKSKNALVSLNSFVGPAAKDKKTAVLLSFYAAACQPCKNDVPYLEALYGAYRAKNFTLLLISSEEPAPGNVPTLWDRYGIVANRYGSGARSYLLSSDGKIVWMGERVVLDDVRRLLGEPASAPLPPALKPFT